MIHHAVRLSTVFAIAASLAAATSVAVHAAGKAEHVRGTVTAVDGGGIRVKTRDGATVSIALPAKVRVSGLKKADLGEIKPGSYVGTAAVPQPDGSLRAQEVVIFPKQMRGVGEGHRKWDLTPDSTMTNADVDLVVDGVKGRVMTLKYKGGSQQVVVPEGTPIVTIVKASRAMLKPGTHIFAVAEKGADGSYTAVRVALGVDGLVPPM